MSPGSPSDQRGGLVAGRDDDVLVAQHGQHPQRRAAAGLGGAEHVALAALLEVEARELEAVQRAGHGVEPLAGRCRRRHLGDEQAQPGVRAPTDAAAQLVQLRDAEPVGVQDDHDRGVRDVDADLDHRRRDEHVDPSGGRTGGEAAHDVVLLVRGAAARAGPRRVRRTADRPRGTGASSTTAIGGRPVVRSPAGTSSAVGRRRRRCAGRRRRPDGPPRPPRAMRCHARSRNAGFSSGGTTWVSIGERPAGSSVRVETSRSPKTVIATVRGIGVAVMTSTCGRLSSRALAAARRAARRRSGAARRRRRARGRRTGPSPRAARGCR